MRVAVISDIHGNFWALSKVLKDIDKRKPDLIVNLGDSLYGPLKPMDTYKLIKSYDIISISGNQDRVIIDNLTKDSTHPTLKFVIDDLDSDAISWLKTLPNKQLINNNIFAFHGTPDSDTTYLLEDLYDGYRLIKDELKVTEYLKGIDAKIILCGHSHTNRLIHASNRLIINPGSVGLQAYDDDLPIYHKIESYNNFAQYCLIDIDDADIKVEQINVQYDFEKAVNCAIDNQRLDWAKWLKFGKV
jgi:putative phosphoesterase